MAPIPSVNPQAAGLGDFLRDIGKLPNAFGRELRAGSIRVAKHVVERSKANARTTAEREVAKALLAKSDRVPTIRVSGARMFKSSSRPNAHRSAKAKAKAIDVWFGTEFGGGKYGAGNPKPRKTYRDGSTIGGGYTTQFRPHLGRTGYFFYPTVRNESKNIDKMYADAVDVALRKAGVESTKADVIDFGLGKVL